MMAYLDNAATSFPKPEEVRLAVNEALQSLTSPGRGGHALAAGASAKLFECRELAAELFSVGEPENIVFTFNATHGLNIAIKSIVCPGDRVLISGYEHNAVLRPLHALGARILIAGFPLFDRQAALKSFEEGLDEDIKAVVCNHVSNVFGFILPIEEISLLCAQRGVPLIIDASQSAGCLPLSMKRLAPDFIAMPGHKGLYGPQGTGILICKAQAKTLIEGGTGSNSSLPGMPDFLPDRQEPGTHNMPGIAGLCAGIKYVLKQGSAKILSKERELIRLANSLLSQNKKVTSYFTENDSLQTGVLSITYEALGCEELAEYLSENNVAVRAGLHCSPLAHISAGTIGRGTVRLSASAFNTKEDILELVKVINKISTFKDVPPF